MRPVLDAIAEHVDGPALGDFPLQPGQEDTPRRAVLAQVKGTPRCPGLGIVEEGGELRQVYAVLAVVVLRVAAYPSGAVGGRPLACHAGPRRAAGGPRQRRADEALEALLGGVGGHPVSL